MPTERTTYLIVGLTNIMRLVIFSRGKSFFGFISGVVRYSVVIEVEQPRIDGRRKALLTLHVIVWLM